MCSMQSMNNNIFFPTKKNHLQLINEIYHNVFTKFSFFGSINDFSLLKFLFSKIASAKCIVVPLMLHIVFHEYVSFII